MLIQGLWVLLTLLDPTSLTLLDPTSAGAPGQLVLGLAVVLAALLVAAALVVPTRPGRLGSGPPGHVRRARASILPRLLDPDAAGRPRPRAPSRRPATA